MTRSQPTGLAAKQAAFVAAITGTGPIPAGFDADRVRVAADSLLHKRAGEVAERWPAVAAAMPDRFTALFSGWAAHRPSRGSFVDGHDFARAHWSTLDRVARRQVLIAETLWDFDIPTPAPRSGVAVRVGSGRVYIGVGGRRLV